MLCVHILSPSCRLDSGVSNSNINLPKIAHDSFVTYALFCQTESYNNAEDNFEHYVLCVHMLPLSCRLDSGASTSNMSLQTSAQDSFVTYVNVFLCQTESYQNAHDSFVTYVLRVHILTPSCRLDSGVPTSKMNLPKQFS